MTVLEIIFGVGFAAVLGCCIYIGRKLQILDIVAGTMETVKFNIKAVANCLTKADRIDFDHSYLKDYSPLKLTQEGKQYLEKIGFVEAFSENQEEFYEVIDAEKPTTKYDVEAAAIKSVFALFDEDYFKPVKIFLYNNPRENIRPPAN